MPAIQRLLLPMLLLIAAIAACADGLAFGKGFTPQLQETDQLAVIDLTPTTADVSMYIAIDKIPPGKPLIYVLPFWHRPEHFTLTEEDLSRFRETRVTPAHEHVQRMLRITSGEAGDRFFSDAAGLSFGLGGMIAKIMTEASTKSRSLSEGNAGLLPYAEHRTAHAAVGLYKLNGQDLQQLIKQAGLPQRYLQPLRKYKTPYFAVMRLTGLPTSPEDGGAIRGVHYRFQHRFKDGRYTYPLGTGAAWPTPITLTEIYLNTQDRYALTVTAPTEGTMEHWLRFSSHVKYAVMPAHQREQYLASMDADDRKEIVQPQTAISLRGMAKHPSAWHIAYLNSNPSQDIHVTVTRRWFPWRVELAELVTLPGAPSTFALLLYLLAWGLCGRLVIRPRWLRAGKPGRLWRHYLQTFAFAQLVSIAIVAGVYGIMLDTSYVTDHYLNGWIAIGSMLVIGIALGGISVIYKRQTGDWRKWLTLTCWGASVLLNALLALGGYALLRLAEAL